MYNEGSLFYNIQSGMKNLYYSRSYWQGEFGLNFGRPVNLIAAYREKGIFLGTQFGITEWVGRIWVVKELVSVAGTTQPNRVKRLFCCFCTVAEVSQWATVLCSFIEVYCLLFSVTEQSMGTHVCKTWWKHPLRLDHLCNCFLWQNGCEKWTMNKVLLQTLKI